MLEGRGRLFLFVMYDEGMDYRNDSANRSDNLENEVRYIHFINPPSIFCTERGTQLKKQSVALSAGVFFQNHHRREPTAIIASLASMLSHIHNYNYTAFNILCQVFSHKI